MRKGLSKKLRFEVFKRDGFVCQYCGGHPPQAILHVDHIHPAAEGGKDSLDNLITACEACNLGKGARLLSDVPRPITDKAEELKEREQQLRGYRQILDERENRLYDEQWEVAEILSPGCSDGQGFNRRDLLTIKRFLEQMGIHAVRRAAEIAYVKLPRSEYQRFKYFCGVCWRMIREPADAR